MRSPRGFGRVCGWCRTTAARWGSSWGERRLLAWLRATATSSSFSAAPLQLRRAIGGAPGHGTEGKRALVSAGCKGKGKEAEGSDGEKQHCLAVVVAYLGHGELEEGHGGLRPCCLGLGCQAAHERVERVRGEQWSGAEKCRARGRLK